MRWFRLVPKGHFGYPQPEGDFGFRTATYDLARYCVRCGIGLRQVRPFRLRKSFTQSRSQFLQLNWVSDEYFVNSETKAAMEEQSLRGVSFLQPVLHRTGESVTLVYQLIVENVLSPALVTDSLRRVTCCLDNEEHWTPPAVPPEVPFCGRVKFHHTSPPPFQYQKEAFSTSPDFIKSAEYFGSGASAFREILVSERVYACSRDFRWRGVDLAPVNLI